MKNIMKRNRIAVGLLVVMVTAFSVVVFAQVSRPFRNCRRHPIQLFRRSIVRPHWTTYRPFLRPRRRPRPC